MSGDDVFNVKLGRIFSPNGTGRFVSFAGRVRRAAQTRSKNRSKSSSKHTAKLQYYSRRVVVKVHLVKMGVNGAAAQRLHLKYIQRDSAAHENEKGRLYSGADNDVDRDSFFERGKDDKHQFRIIVSPEDGKQLGDLRIFTRNVMAQMERDLGTKLEWVAADHYDTANPHSHIVIRGVKDNGKTLIIPREYISHGMREAAENIATLELGPVTQIDVAKKLARQVEQERFTSIDRDLLARANNNIVDLSKPPLDGTDWSHRFQSWRVKHLSRLGLAQKTGFARWRLDDKVEHTLRRMGERDDILKAYHKAMGQSKLERPTFGEPIYDPQSELAKPVTGRVIAKGILDDVNDRSYVVIDTLHGEAIFAETGRYANLDEVERHMIVTVSPQDFEPKPSDFKIADIASKRGGIYSPSAHSISDPSASDEYIKAHVRRLEAMRRKGHATRHKDGSWEIPKDYLKRARNFERKAGFGNPVRIEINSRQPLSQLQSVIGRTWLDQSLRDNPLEEGYDGFGDEVKTAKLLRHKYLVQQGLIAKGEVLRDQGLKALETLDLDAAAKGLKDELGKSYAPMAETGRISGTYREAIERPSGKYAIIEKSKEFTLVPWRKTMDRNLGKNISGIIKGQSISWTLTKARGRSMS